MLPTCVLIATGGTIAMKLDAATGAAVPALSGEDLIAAVPALASVARVEVTNLSNVPSDYMNPPRWVALHRAIDGVLKRDDVAGVVVTHGTDTLEETASFLDQTLSGDKPVVLTGAQRNASASDFDGPRNLLAAVRTSVSPQARKMGVLVVMNDRISAARDATKLHTSAVEAFGPSEAGFLGEALPQRIAFFRRPAQHVRFPLHTTDIPRVDIVAMYAGADGALVDAAVQNGAKGIVIQALGLGNVNMSMYHAICKAIQDGVTVVIGTRVTHGSVQPLYGFEGGGHSLAEAGALFAGYLSPQKARVSLMLALQAGMKPAQMQAVFET